MELPLRRLLYTQKIVFLSLITTIPLYYTLLIPLAWNDFAPSPQSSSSSLISLPLSPTSQLSSLDNINNSIGNMRLSSSLPSAQTPSPLSLDDVNKYSTVIATLQASPSPSSSSSSLGHEIINSTVVIASPDKKCNIFKGDWVWNPDGPYYTNTTCLAISDRQNCMKHGRPDMDFLKWRWKPNGCELPIFDPASFLELVSGKSMAFVGDSVARNQMQSLICLLSKVEYPADHSYTPDDKFKNLVYMGYNFTLASFWSPHLVRAEEATPGLLNLYLDQFDEQWTAHIDRFDYVIVSAGHWFFRPLLFYEGGRIIGCHDCSMKKIAQRTMYYGYQKALRTAFRAIKGGHGHGHHLSNRIVFLRMFSPAHYENGVWNQGGKCGWTRPLTSHEARLEGSNLDLYMAQLKEFKAARKRTRNRGLKYRLLDTTRAMLMRPDGHPSHYGHPQAEQHPYQDCVHWCLPGPIDVWNEFLLQTMKMEGG